MPDGSPHSAPLAANAGGPTAFWSQIAVPGRPRVLVLDATRNREGWEADSCNRVSNSLVRREIPVVGGGPLPAGTPAELGKALQPTDGYNCIFLCARADGEWAVADCWAELKTGLAGTSKLLAICTWDGVDAETSEEVLRADDSFAVLAASQQSPLSVRAAGLFFMKFFAELDLHSHASNSMTGKMVWFGHSKAREILRRRKYEGRVGLKA